VAFSRIDHSLLPRGSCRYPECGHLPCRTITLGIHERWITVGLQKLYLVLIGLGHPQHQSEIIIKYRFTITETWRLLKSGIRIPPSKLRKLFVYYIRTLLQNYIYCLAELVRLYVSSVQFRVSGKHYWKTDASRLP